ncbi:MAG: FmdB family zinc ribbon protein [Gemmatimonadaceae bacterium]
MPTYDFVCPAEHEFERFYKKISDAPAEVPCVVCGKPAVRRVSGGAGLIFKGSGFYITDYGKDGKKAQQKEKAGEGKGAEGAGAGETKGGGEGRGGRESRSGSASPAETSAAESKTASKSTDSNPAGAAAKDSSTKGKESGNKE